MKDKLVISAEVRKELAESVSKFLMDSMILSQNVKRGQSGLMSLDEYQSRIRGLMNNPMEAARFIYLNLEKIIVSEHEIIELANLVKESIQKYNYLGAAGSGAFVLFIKQALESLEKSIISSDDLYDSEKKLR